MPNARTYVHTYIPTIHAYHIRMPMVYTYLLYDNSVLSTVYVCLRTVRSHHVTCLPVIPAVFACRECLLHLWAQSSNHH